MCIRDSAITAATLISSCVSRGNNPGWEYAPDMYYSKGYEAYNQGDSNVVNPYGMNMREPVAGTVAYGKLDYKLNSGLNTVVTLSQFNGIMFFHSL